MATLIDRGSSRLFGTLPGWHTAERIARRRYGLPSEAWDIAAFISVGGLHARVTPRFVAIWAACATLTHCADATPRQRSNAEKILGPVPQPPVRTSCARPS